MTRARTLTEIAWELENFEQTKAKKARNRLSYIAREIHAIEESQRKQTNTSKAVAETTGDGQAAPSTKQCEDRSTKRWSPIAF